jgi:hypothetical protein
MRDPEGFILTGPDVLEEVAPLAAPPPAVAA